jgi:hypothetical protein
MSVKNGRIVLPDGMSYSLLVLQNCTSPLPDICDKVAKYQKLPVSPVPSKAMSPEVIKKLRELILAGATVVGPPPEYATGLEGYPESDVLVRRLAKEVWGDLDGEIITERRYGKGRVIWGKTAREIMLSDNIAPDCTYQGEVTNTGQFDYIHRRLGDAEIYFIVNRTNRSQKSDFTFRVSGKQPEIWNPVTGVTMKAGSFLQSKGTTTLNLQLDRFGSCFIVFREPVPADAAGRKSLNYPALKDMAVLNGPWKVSFDPLWGGPESVTFPGLVSWTDRQEEGISYYSGKATYRKEFDFPSKQEGEGNNKSSTGRLMLDLGELRDVAEVRLNGINFGILWCSPWRVEITDAVKPSGNLLEVDVVNLWANRVIGDMNRPKDQRFTQTHDGFRFDFLTGRTPLLRSGLFGPVKICLETY